MIRRQQERVGNSPQGRRVDDSDGAIRTLSHSDQLAWRASNAP